MKIKKTLIVSALLTLVSLSACGETAHTHEYVTKYDKGFHWDGCECGDVQNKSAHTLTKKYDEENHWKECECGYKENVQKHQIVKHSEDGQHWYTCDCGYESAKSAHVFLDKHDAEHHWKECECGETKDVDNHTINWNYDSTQHWLECECGETTTKENHNLEWRYNNDQHWQECNDCPYDSTRSNHVYNISSDILVAEATCTEQAKYLYKCECGKEGNPAVNWYYDGEVDSSNHEFNYKGECTHNGCTEVHQVQGSLTENGQTIKKIYIDSSWTTAVIKFQFEKAGNYVLHSSNASGYYQIFNAEGGEIVPIQFFNKQDIDCTFRTTAKTFYVKFTNLSVTSSDYFSLLENTVKTNAYGYIRSITKKNNNYYIETNPSDSMGKGWRVGDYVDFTTGEEDDYITSRIEEIIENRTNVDSSSGFCTLVVKENTETAKISSNGFAGNFKGMTFNNGFKSRIYALTKNEHGRHTPFFTNYYPEFYFTDKENGEAIGGGFKAKVTFTDIGMISPGEVASVTMVSDVEIPHIFVKGYFFLYESDNSRRSVEGYVTGENTTVSTITPRQFSYNVKNFAVKERGYTVAGARFSDLALTKVVNSDDDLWIYKYFMDLAINNPSYPSYVSVTGRGVCLRGERENVYALSTVDTINNVNTNELLGSDVYAIDANGDIIDLQTSYGVYSKIIGINIPGSETDTEVTDGLIMTVLCRGLETSIAANIAAIYVNR